MTRGDAGGGERAGGGELRSEECPCCLHSSPLVCTGCPCRGEKEAAWGASFGSFGACPTLAAGWLGSGPKVFL